MNKIALIAFAAIAGIFSNSHAFAERPISVTHYAKAKIAMAHCTSLRRPNESVWDWQVCDKESYCSNPKCPCSKPKAYVPSYAIKTGDAFSITLHQALIHDFPEFTLIGRKAGDIAIVATVKERKSGVDFDFTDNAATNGRVVFYQANVEAGSVLNLSNVPVYGPARYEGYPLMITLHVLEIDEKDSKVTAGIVGKLAQMARDATALASPKAMSILDTLGSFLLAENKNDVLARYDMELEPFGDHHISLNLLSPILEYGNYVFVVAKDGTNWISWDHYSFNQKNSRLYYKSEVNESDQWVFKDTCTNPVKDKTWLTFQIQKASKDRTAALPATNTLKALLESLDRDAQADVERVNKLASDLTELNEQQKLYDHSLAVIDSLDPSNRDNWGQEIKNELNDILQKIGETTTKGKSGEKGPYSVSQAKRLVSELKRLILPEGNRVILSYERFDPDKAKGLLMTQ